MTPGDYIWKNIGDLRLYENLTNIYDSVFTNANQRGNDSCLKQNAFEYNGTCTCKINELIIN